MHKLSAFCVAVLTSVENVEEYNAGIIPVADNVDDTSTTELGMRLCEYFLECCLHPMPPLIHLSCIHQHYNSTDGSKLLRIDDAHDSSLSAMSIITLNFGTPVVQHGNGTYSDYFM